MTKHNWKPGDVAMVTWPTNLDGEFAVVRGEGRWHMLDYVASTATDDDGPFLSDHWLADLDATLRPLVVIDPEDREQAERLRKAFGIEQAERLRKAFGISGPLFTVDDMQSALREFANPTPPKPDEPTGLGAVVEDADGVPWVRCENANRVPHWYARNKQRNYDDIAAVRVLSDGVTA